MGVQKEEWEVEKIFKETMVETFQTWWKKLIYILEPQQAQVEYRNLYPNTL